MEILNEHWFIAIFFAFGVSFWINHMRHEKRKAEIRELHRKTDNIPQELQIMIKGYFDRQGEHLSKLERRIDDLYKSGMQGN